MVKFSCHAHAARQVLGANFGSEAPQRTRPDLGALASFAFAWRQTEATARALLWTSLVYLPLLFSLILFDQALYRSMH